MKVINAKYEVINEDNQLKKVERIARTCYKSEDKITDDNTSAVAIIKNLVDREHYAMLEHTNLVLSVPKDEFTSFLAIIEDRVYQNRVNYFRFTNTDVAKGKGRCLISANYRAWLEFLDTRVTYPLFIQEYFKILKVSECAMGSVVFSKYLEELNVDNFKVDDAIVKIINTKDLTGYERAKHQLYTVKFTVDRGVTHELVRHRPCSFAQESTRYCNYAKDKFGNELTFIKPIFFKDGSLEYKLWEASMLEVERVYLEMLNSGVKPEEARTVLPNSIKSEIYMTAYQDEWEHIFELRSLDRTGKAHPQMKEVMVPLHKEFGDNYIN